MFYSSEIPTSLSVRSIKVIPHKSFEFTQYDVYLSDISVILDRPFFMNGATIPLGILIVGNDR